MRFTVIVKYIGVACLLMSAFMFLSAIVSAINAFDEAFWPLMYSASISGIMGAFPSIFVRKGKKISRAEGYYIVVFSWLLCSLLGTVPYLMYGREFNFTNALFESVSGFTTTGASIIPDIEAIPRGLLLWRMSTAWIGGIGIIALFSWLLPFSKNNGSTLTGVEMSQIARGATGLRAGSFAKVTVITYLMLSVTSIISLKLAGMDWFDAITHGMSACSTCGFSTHNQSIAYFDSGWIESILIVFMLLSSLRFALLGNIFTKKGLRALLSSEVSIMFFMMIAVGFTMIFTSLAMSGTKDSLASCARASIFQTASIFTTTGFATEDTTTWPSLCITVLVAGSIICGCSGSTSGGMKVDRAILGAKSLWQRILEMRSPNRVCTVRIDGRIIDAKTSREALIFITCYILLITFGALLNSLSGADITTAWTAAVACISNVGPGFGNIGSMSNYAELPVLAKYSSMILMFIGRLEIFPVLYVLRVSRRVS